MLRNIVIDLDMLLDTRAGTLRRIIPLEEVEQVINSETYRLREHERIWEMCSISKEDWEAGWSLRDETTLAFSKPTLAMADFPRLLADLNKVVEGNNPGLSDVRFIINTYPYNLSPEVKAKIASACQYNFSTTCDVVTATLDYSRLSPSLCKERNIIMMFIYDIVKYNQACFPDDVKWSMENLPTPNEELTVVTPRIDRDHFGERKDIDELGVELPKGISSFEISVELLRLIYGIEFANASYVCEVSEEVWTRISQGLSHAKGSNPTPPPTPDISDDDGSSFDIPDPNPF